METYHLEIEGVVLRPTFHADSTFYIPLLQQSHKGVMIKTYLINAQPFTTHRQESASHTSAAWPMQPTSRPGTHLRAP